MVKQILIFSPCYALSQAMRVAGVDELRIAALRFDRTRRVISSGAALDVACQSIALPPQHRIIEMILIPGTPLLAYLDQHGGVHIADVATGSIRNTWQYPHPVQEINLVTLLLWVSLVHGLVLVVHLSRLRCVYTFLSPLHLLRDL
jgi:hypothetical protein